MKYLILILPCLLTAHSLQYEWNHLSHSQKAVAYKTFYTAKKFNFQYTMTAIAWRESNFGKWKLNLNDPSCGY